MSAKAGSQIQEHDQRDNLGDKAVKLNSSQFKIKSIGYAAENLDITQTKLEVTPIEEHGYLHGEIKSDKTPHEETGVDAHGNTYNVKMHTSNAISAEWLQWGSNRQSPPYVRRGERVLIWQYSDHDKYYWSSLGLDDHLRRLETVIFVLSNTRDEKTTKLTPDNAYYVEWSTINKNLTIKTNKSDKENPEPYAYTVQINTKDGTVFIGDDVGNSFSLDSKASGLYLETAQAAKIHLNGADATVEIPGNLDIKAGSMTTTASSNTVNADTVFTKSIKNNGKDIGSSHRHTGTKAGSDTSGSVA